MFRSKKVAGQTVVDSPTQPEPAEVVPPADEMPPLQTRRNIPFAARPMPATPFPLDVARRNADFGLPSGRGEPATSVAIKDKVLTVGRDVRLSGEIAACDKLIVEGVVELSVTGARMLNVGASGTFKGSADVAEAEIGGHFDGSLVVRDRLTIRSGGHVRGRIRYGQIVIEAGGTLIGDVAALQGEEADDVQVPSAHGFTRSLGDGFDPHGSAVTIVADAKLAASAD